MASSYFLAGAPVAVVLAEEGLLERELLKERQRAARRSATAEAEQVYTRSQHRAMRWRRREAINAREACSGAFSPPLARQNFWPRSAQI
jgi:hypothetical protein